MSGEQSVSAPEPSVQANLSPARLAEQFHALSDADKLSFWRLTVCDAAWAQVIIENLPASERRRLLANLNAPPFAVVDQIISTVFELLAENTEGPIVPRTRENLEALVRARFGFGRRDVHNRVVEELNRAETAIRAERDKERNPKPRKRERNYLIHYLLTERGLDWPDVRKSVLEHYPQMLKGKSKNKDIEAMQGMYYPWLKTADHAAEYGEWLKTHQPT